MKKLGYLLLALTLCVGCVDVSVENKKTPGASASGNQIRIDLHIYSPGLIPVGIGEPNEVATHVAKEWTEEHPDWPDIKYQPLVQTGTSEGEWLKTQLLGGIAPEVIQQNAEVAWPDTDKGWFIPLDEFLERPNPYVSGNEHWIDLFSNQALVGAKRAPDGKLYCIPIDIVETGLFYNKDLLAEIGIEKMPETWAEMMDMMRRIDEAGYIPMVAGGNLASDWGQDIIFEMLYHDILPRMDMIPSRPDAEGYLGHYLEAAEAGFLHTKGFFTPRDPRWREMNRILYEWRQYWAKELKNGDPDRLFLTGRAAMYWNGSWFIRRLRVDEYVDFEWGVTYLPPITQETSRFAHGTEATVIGGAAMQYHVTNSTVINDNLEETIDFLMYLSSPQVIERLTAEAMMFIPNITGAEMDPNLQPFQEIFKRRYCAIKWLESMDGQYKKYWRRMLDYYLNEGIDLDEFLVHLDKNFTAWVESHQGDEAWNFEKMETVWQERKEKLLREIES